MGSRELYEAILDEYHAEDDVRVRRYAARVLGNMSHQEVASSADKLVKALAREEDAEALTGALPALRQLGRSRAVELLVELSKSRRLEVQAVAYMLATWNDGLLDPLKGELERRSEVGALQSIRDFEAGKHQELHLKPPVGGGEVPPFGPDGRSGASGEDDRLRR